MTVSTPTHASNGSLSTDMEVLDRHRTISDDEKVIEADRVCEAGKPTVEKTAACEEEDPIEYLKGARFWLTVATYVLFPANPLVWF